MKKKIKKYLIKAERKLEKICRDIKNNVIRRRGFNAFSKYAGLLSQRMYWRSMEKKGAGDVRVNRDCVLCGKCVEFCPRTNLFIEKERVTQKKKCTLCYRCVNICPKMAITVLVHSQVKKQYRGPISARF